jgi:uncharacterized protein YukE
MTWVGPVPLDLHLPAGLAGADPAALRSRAAAHRADADVLCAQGAALRSAVVRLVPAAWLGLGALSFAATALLQAGSLETIAAASAELAAALTALASALETAREDALAAVRAAGRLDAEVHAENARLARRPEPERIGPGPGALDAQVAAARQLVARLAAAEESPRRRGGSQPRPSTWSATGCRPWPCACRAVPPMTGVRQRA